MRRMKEMAGLQAGMSFYGEMPDMFNLVVNTDHRLVKQVLDDEQQACAASLAPIEEELERLTTRRDELEKAHQGKKSEEIPTAEKDELTSLRNQMDECENRKKNILGEYAGQNKLVRQLVDLALLQNHMLNGEALNRFVQRSIELI